jgi:hypothetical protein
MKIEDEILTCLDKLLERTKLDFFGKVKNENKKVSNLNSNLTSLCISSNSAEL